MAMSCQIWTGVWGKAEVEDMRVSNAGGYTGSVIAVFVHGSVSRSFEVLVR